MKNTFLSAILMIALCGCVHNHHEETAAEHQHLHLHNFTAYTEANEFFMQHEGLEAGKESCITLFVTALNDFKPSTASEVKATLKVGENAQTAVAKSSTPGIFNFKLVPKSAGAASISFDAGGDEAHFHVDIMAPDAGHNHVHGESSSGHSHAEEHSHGADVSCEGHSHDAEHFHSHSHEHAHQHDHSHPHTHSHDAHMHAGHAHAGHGEQTEGASGDIAFGKEQSWKIDFATAVVKESHFGGAVKVAAKVAAVPSNFTTVVAATSGKVQFVGNVVEGKAVAAGEPLFYLEGGDVTDNDAAVKFAEAESNYLLAKADYERKRLLFDEMVVSEREFQSAEALFKQAEARFVSMKRSFGDGKVVLKAAKAGYIASLLVANGDYVEPGTPIATIQSDGNVNIAAELPVRFAQQLQNIEDVNIVLPSGEAFSMNALGGSVVAVGSSANSCNMLPVTITAAAIDGVVPGSIVTLYIVSKSSGHAVAVPRTALVEEMGNYFVFVQNNPISFEKRAVEVGSTDGMRVEIAKGLDAGERVVTKGAVALKLSQGAAALDPHAGHVH